MAFGNKKALDRLPPALLCWCGLPCHPKQGGMGDKCKYF